MSKTKTLIKTVPLTDAQFDRLEMDLRGLEAMPKLIGQSIAAATKEYARTRNEFWESVNKLAGTKTDYRQQVQIDWVLRRIEVYQLEEEDMS